ncbi:MAG: RNA 2',3'-cyclic phosphodiesterase [Thermoleophilia bacterium]|nr:RNA 2',3'-cyclic phosphodiesterase [Thermoleophilia bacterium]MDQ3857939.1 RNA 2',3'-cyclic phosphodiesterase [Actinomycetota bacterium]
MEGGDRLRLFVALPLPAEARERLVAWQRAALASAGDARVVPPENLHVTLVFLGARSVGEIDAIVREIRAAVRGVTPPALLAVGYRETRSVGMVVFHDEGGRASELAGRVSESLARLGVYEPERRSWLPHVTVLRFRRPPRLRPDPPDLGRLSPSEVALYHSVLRRAGAQYEVRESVPLGG